MGKVQGTKRLAIVLASMAVIAWLVFCTYELRTDESYTLARNWIFIIVVAVLICASVFILFKTILWVTKGFRK